MPELIYEHATIVDNGPLLIETFVEATRQKHPKYFGRIFQHQMDNACYQSVAAYDLEKDSRDNPGQYHLVTARTADGDLAGFAAGHASARRPSFAIDYLCALTALPGTGALPEALDADLFAELTRHVPRHARIIEAATHMEMRGFYENMGMRQHGTPSGNNGVTARPATRMLFNEECALMTKLAGVPAHARELTASRPATPGI